MRDYTIQGPDGRPLTISGPANATPEQLRAAAERAFGVQASRETPNPTEGNSFLENAAIGAGKAVADAGRGIRGLLPWTDKDALRAEIEESRRLDAPLMETGGGITGNIGGNLALLLGPGAGLRAAGGVANALNAGSAAARLTGAGNAVMAPTTIKGATALGAAAGATQPAVDMGERALNTLIGAGASGAGQAVMRGAARVISPNTSPEVRALMGQGVTPTPGQILGGGAKRVEEALTSVPLVGDAIRAGQSRAVGDLNNAAFNRVLSPLGEKMPKGMQGRDAITYVGDRVSARYDELLPQLTTQADGAFIDDISNIQNMMASGSIDPAKAKQFEAILQSQVLGKFQPGADGAPTITGQTLKGIESDLGQLARNYRGSPDPDQRMLGDALMEVQSILRETVQRSNPQLAGELRAINQAFANLVRVEKAAGMRGAKEGVFSASQLGSAVKASDKSARKRAVARGDALMQDLSDAGEKVLGPNLPDSGTAMRLLTGAGAAGGLALLEPTALAGAAAGGAAYSRPGQQALAALLTRRPDAAAPTAAALRRIAPYASVPAIQLEQQR